MSEERTWQAFQYVSGELTPDEEQAFEAELADDQSLRELVADLVTTCEAVCVVESQTVTTSAPPAVTPRRGRLFAASVAVALGLLLAVAARFGPHADNGLADTNEAVVPTPAPIDGIAEEDVLAMWAESAVEQDPEIGLDGLLGQSVDLAESSDEEFVVPGWMFAALEPERMEEMMEEAGDTLPETSSN